MLFLHETHEVLGTREDAFEVAFRDVWMPALAAGNEARLLYYLNHAHGTGRSYRVVTLSAVRDGAAWERLVQRIDAGDLREPAESLDALRHDVLGKLLIPLAWSPLQKVDLESIPTRPAEHELGVFMEDTVWPHEGRLADYVERSGSHYAREMAEAARGGARLLEVRAGFRTAFGSHRRREIVLWQKVIELRGLAPLISREVPAGYKTPGSWMHDALELRDQWESRLLRTSAWSPLY